MNYHNRKFRPEATSENGEVDSTTVFHYQQVDGILSCTYRGSNILHGQLLGTVTAEGIIEMRYQHINTDGALMTGQCQSTPELLPNGKIRLHERWQWTCGDQSAGSSTLIEL